MEDVKIPVSEDTLRKAAQMLMNQKIHYQGMASKARTDERKKLWWAKSMKVAEVHEAICRALVEAEDAEA